MKKSFVFMALGLVSVVSISAQAQSSIQQAAEAFAKGDFKCTVAEVSRFTARNVKWVYEKQGDKVFSYWEGYDKPYAYWKVIEKVDVATAAFMTAPSGRDAGSLFRVMATINDHQAFVRVDYRAGGPELYYDCTLLKK